MAQKLSPKTISRMRFQLLNLLVDEIATQLPKEFRYLLLACYRHADAKGRFRVSNGRLADACGVSSRTIVRQMNYLSATGVIRLEKEHIGPLPRLYRITGQPPRYADDDE
jgi:predicted DNA-binding transcriptional regulator YafY